VVGALAVASLAAACSGDKGVQVITPHASVPTAPVPTTNPYAIPAVIDAAYVNRILAALDAVNGDVLRLLAKTRTVPDEARARLKAMYVDREYLGQVSGLATEQADGFPGLKPNPGNRRTVVSKLLVASSSCVFAKVDRDQSPVGDNPSPDLAVQWVGLVPLDPSRDPNRYNPTPWMYVYDGFPASHSEPKNPCGNPS